MASSVQAHSSLEDTFPKGNEVLDKSPSKIEVWYQDPVVIHSNSIKIMDAKGGQILTNKTISDPKDAGHIMTNLKEDLDSGQYTVTINVLALDGYSIEEKFRFSINKSASESAVIVKSNIKDGEIHIGSPKKMELWFNQPAQVTAFGVFDDQQQVVQTQEPKANSNDPSHLSIPFAEKLQPGTYQVSWYASPSDEENQTL